MRKGFHRPVEKRYRLNNQISAPEVRLLDAMGKQIGVVSMGEALKLSHEEDLDLVEIAGQAKPPVVKLIDYRKFLYQEKKRKQEEKRNAHVTETKQIRFGPFIDEHDLGIKMDRAREFLAVGDKVKFIIRFQGRAITKQDMGRQLLNTVITKMSDCSKVEREIHMEGRQMIVVLSRARPEDTAEKEQDEQTEIKS